MPYNYSPGVAFESGNLARGIERMGEAVSEAVKARKKDEQDRARSFKAMQTIAEKTYGIDPNVSITWDYDRLRGELESKVLQQKAKEFDQRTREHDLRIKRFERDEAAEADLPKFFREYFRDPNAPDANALPNAPGVALPSMPPSSEDRFRRGMEAGPNAVMAPQFDNTFSAMERARFPQRANGWALPPGATMPGPNGTTAFATSPNSYQLVTPPKAGPRLAGNYDWTLTDDVEAFKKGLRAIADPLERAAVVKERTDYMRAIGRPDPVEEALAEAVRRSTKGGTEEKSWWGSIKSALGMGDEPEAAGASTTTSAPKVGEVRDGYKFNGKFPPGDRRAWDKQ